MSARGLDTDARGSGDSPALTPSVRVPWQCLGVCARAMVIGVRDHYIMGLLTMLPADTPRAKLTIHLTRRVHFPEGIYTRSGNGER